jgi:hypothetical protein
MIKHKWYRAFRVIFGARSFFNASNYPDVRYVIIRGRNINKLTDYMLDDGWVEEFTDGW